MKESHKMELTMDFNRIESKPIYFINKKMSNKYLFFKKLYSNNASYFVKNK